MAKPPTTGVGPLLVWSMLLYAPRQEHHPGTMIDFSGWWYNWEWSGEEFSTPPSWLRICAITAGGVGLASVLATWWMMALPGPAWAFALMVPGLVIEATTHSVVGEWRNLLISYGLVLFIAGVFALMAFELPNESVRSGFAMFAPCLTIGVGPLTSRTVEASLFSLRMVDRVKDQQELVRAALAGEGSALVVRVEHSDDDEAKLFVLGEAGQTLRARWEMLNRRPFAYSGVHLLLQEPEIGDMEAGEDYRGNVRRLVACKKVAFLGRKPSALSSSAYFDEVRAALIVLALEHALVAIVALSLA